MGDMDSLLRARIRTPSFAFRVDARLGQQQERQDAVFEQEHDHHNSEHGEPSRKSSFEPLGGCRSPVCKRSIETAFP
jgi:hypothetical protein